MDQAQQRLVELYPANVRKYVVLATVNALILMIFNWVIFFVYCRPIMPFGICNLIYVATLWSRWSNKISQLTFYLIYLLFSLSLLIVSLSRSLTFNFETCPSEGTAVTLFVFQLLFILAGFGLAVYLRNHIRDTVALIGAMRITQAEHQAILAQPAVRQSYGAPPPAYAAVGSGDGLAK